MQLLPLRGLRAAGEGEGEGDHLKPSSILRHLPLPGVRGERGVPGVPGVSPTTPPSPATRSPHPRYPSLCKGSQGRGEVECSSLPELYPEPVCGPDPAWTERYCSPECHRVSRELLSRGQPLCHVVSLGRELN